MRETVNILSLEVTVIPFSTSSISVKVLPSKVEVPGLCITSAISSSVSFETLTSVPSLRLTLCPLTVNSEVVLNVIVSLSEK